MGQLPLALDSLESRQDCRVTRCGGLLRHGPLPLRKTNDDEMSEGDSAGSTKATDPRGALKATALVANVGFICLGGLLYPIFRDLAIVAVGLPLLVVNGLLIYARLRGGSLMGSVSPWSAIEGARRLQNLGLCILALIVFFGGTELVVRVLTDYELLGYRAAMLTQASGSGGVEDWRIAHITADSLREPDPILFWRPVDRPPYNSHRLKGPEPAIPKPPGTFRIMAYGDSNTDGPPHGGWPDELQRLLARDDSSVDAEVLNAAGVTGYSSHQGLLRFRQHVDSYQPDLALVAFGWNDAAPAVGGADKEFRPPPWLIVKIQRVLVKYRTYLAAQYYLERLRPPPDKVRSNGLQRVSVDDYRGNLAGFLDTGSDRAVDVVLIARLHEDTPEDMREEDDWRSSIPDYNDALRLLATERNAPMFDAQRLFEARPQDFVDQAHLLPQGHRLLAVQLLEFLRSRELIPSLEVSPGH